MRYIQDQVRYAQAMQQHAADHKAAMDAAAQVFRHEIEAVSIELENEENGAAATIQLNMLKTEHFELMAWAKIQSDIMKEMVEMKTMSDKMAAGVSLQVNY